MAGTPVQCLRIEVVLNPAASSREKIMNVWHIATVGATTPDTAAADFVNTTLNAFYQEIDVMLSVELEGAVPHVRSFNLIEPKPRQPHAEMDLSALDAGTTKAQRESAVCLSYKALYQSGVSPKRRRGRIYLGPFYATVLDTATGKLNSTVKSNLVTAGQNLFDDHQSSALWSWVVYSPTTDTSGTGETGMYEVTDAWVDDEIDTQRRRGLPQPGSKSAIN